MSENYELHIEKPLPYNPLNGRFIRGHVPHNKGKKWPEYFDMRKAKRVLKYLELGRIKGNSSLPGRNRKEIVGIKDGKLIAFKSSIEAAKILKAKGIRVNSRNIRSVCHGKPELVQKKYHFIRRKAGGYEWYFASDVEKYKDKLF